MFARCWRGGIGGGFVGSGEVGGGGLVGVGDWLRGGDEGCALGGW